MVVLRALQGIENVIRKCSRPLVGYTNRLPVYTILGVLAILAIVHLQYSVSTIFPRSVKYKISLGKLPLPNVIWCLFAVNIISVYFFNEYYMLFVKIVQMRSTKTCDALSRRIEMVEKCSCTLDYLDTLISKIERLHKRMLGQLDAIRITFIEEEVVHVAEPNNDDDETRRPETLTVRNDLRDGPNPDGEPVAPSPSETDSDNTTMLIETDGIDLVPDDNNIDYFVTRNSSTSESEVGDDAFDDEIKFRLNVAKKTNDPINVVSNVIGDLFNDFDMPMILEESETESTTSSSASERDGRKRNGRNADGGSRANNVDAARGNGTGKEATSVHRGLDGSFSTKTFTVDKTDL